jgi:hypothetical protein
MINYGTFTKDKTLPKSLLRAETVEIKMKGGIGPYSQSRQGGGGLSGLLPPITCFALREGE